MELRKISHSEIKEIIKKHKKWLRGEDGGEIANLSGSDLSGSNLSYSNLSYSNLRGSNAPPLSLACPSNGEFIAWKKCRGDRIVELFIPADAKRVSATTEKCRCDKAQVVSIKSIDESEIFHEAVSSYDGNFVYRVGETVSVENFDENRWNECSTGIHFFVDREEAVRY